MSRIGLKPIALPSGVELHQEADVVTVTGPKGEVSVRLPADISVEVKDGILHTVLSEEGAKTIQGQENHGTTASLVHAAVIGVSEGWKKELIVSGTGYRASIKNGEVVMFLGYSVEKKVAPVGKYTKITCPDDTHIVVEGCNKQEVGQTAALIYDCHRPDVYGQKGVHYAGQKLIKKVGKRASSGKK